MISTELLLDATDAWLIVVSAAGILLAVVIYTRLIGLRTFSKMSSFDFAVTVAIGSVMASVSLTGSSLLAGVLAVGALLGVQYLVAQLRKRGPFSSVVDNAPIVLMAGSQFLHDNLRRTRVTEDDVRAKLREANAYNYDMILGVILETTGDISVIHGDHPLDLDIFRDVTDHHLLEPGGPSETRTGTSSEP